MKTKVAVSLDSSLVKALDARVKKHEFASRSAAIEAALRNQATRQAKAKRDAEYLAMLAQLDPVEEVAFAEERFKGEVFG